MSIRNASLHGEMNLCRDAFFLLGDMIYIRVIKELGIKEDA